MDTHEAICCFALALAERDFVGGLLFFTVLLKLWIVPSQLLGMTVGGLASPNAFLSLYLSSANGIPPQSGRYCFIFSRLCDHGAGSGRLVLPGWLKDTNSLV